MKAYANLAVLMLGFLMLVPTSALAQVGDSGRLEEENKRIARDFYQDLWFSDNTDNYGLYVASTYVVHDIGDRKGVTEPAVEQKHIADFFWGNGTLSGNIDYQLAEGNLVATRLTVDFEPETLFGRLVLGNFTIPVINVFRIEDGKIVEFWNHRHDIDGPQTMRFTIQGLLAGMAIALIPLFWAVSLRRRLKRALSG